MNSQTSRLPHLDGTAKPVKAWPKVGNSCRCKDCDFLLNRLKAFMQLTANAIPVRAAPCEGSRPPEREAAAVAGPARSVTILLHSIFHMLQRSESVVAQHQVEFKAVARARRISSSPTGIVSYLG